MVFIHRRGFVAASAAAFVAPRSRACGRRLPSRPRETIRLGASCRVWPVTQLYNNGTAVAGSAEIVDRWIAASAAFRAQRPKQPRSWPMAPGERNKWDLFPAADPKAPCLVFIHGGYWQARNREHFSCFAEGVMARGWSVAMLGLYVGAGCDIDADRGRDPQRAPIGSARRAARIGISRADRPLGLVGRRPSCRARLGSPDRQSGLCRIRDL